MSPDTVRFCHPHVSSGIWRRLGFVARGRKGLAAAACGGWAWCGTQLTSLMAMSMVHGALAQREGRGRAGACAGIVPRDSCHRETEVASFDSARDDVAAVHEGHAGCL